MFEQHAGHRLTCEKVTRSHLRPRRPLVGSCFPASSGHEIRQGCQHSWFVQVFGPRSLARFVPCQPSAQYTSLLHVGWEQCGHALSYRPRESCDMQVMHSLVGFFGYTEGAATELYGGILKLRYSSAPFSKRFPSWPVSDTSSTPVVGSSPVSRFHSLDRGPVCGPLVKRVRITAKHTAVKRKFQSSGEHPTPLRWKTLILQRLGQPWEEFGSPPDLFPRLGVG